MQLGWSLKWHQGAQSIWSVRCKYGKESGFAQKCALSRCSW